MLLLFLLTFNQAKSQAPNWEWARSSSCFTSGYCYGEGFSVATYVSNSIYVAGWFLDTIAFGSYILNDTVGVFITKYDSLGNVQWAKGAEGSSVGNKIVTDILGNIYFTGWFLDSAITFDSFTLTSLGNASMFLVKYDSLGNVLWAKNPTDTGTSRGIGVSTDSFGNVYVAGDFVNAPIVFGSDTLISSGGYDVFLAKYDSAGNVLWAKRTGGTGTEEASSVSTDNFNNVYVTGNFGSASFIFNNDTLLNPGGFDMFIAKYDSQGNEVWARYADDSLTEESWNSATDAFGNIYVTGLFYSSISFGSITLNSAGGLDAFLVKYDSSGNVIWAKSYGSTGNEHGYCLTSDSSGNIFFTGDFSSPSITLDTITLQYPVGGADPMFLAKFDSSGNVFFAKELPSGGDDQNAIAITPSGSIYIGGDFYQIDTLIIATDTLIRTGLEDVFVAKLGYSSSVGITEIKINNECVLYPNPFTNSVRVKTNNNEQFQIILYDIVSRKLLQRNFTNTTTINTEQLASGLYIYEVRNKNGILANGKVIKR